LIAATSPRLFRQPPNFEHVGLTEALELCLLLADKEPQRFGRAAVRWHGRFCREANVDLEEAQAVLAALGFLAGERKRTLPSRLPSFSAVEGWSVPAWHLQRGRERRRNYAEPLRSGRRRYRMHAVVARSTLHDFEKARSFLKEEGIPRISQAPGFVSAQWVRLDDTTGTSMLTFESEEAANKAAEMLKANPPGGDAITINSIEIGEVVERV
jgi:hypothetical protein